MVEIREFLVPLDGSHLAEAVLPPTERLAAHLRARVVLLHVLEEAVPETVHGEPHLAGEAEAERYLRAVASRLTEKGLAVDYHVHPNPERDVVKSIVEHAEEWRSELIVLCSHGRSGLRHALLGSIAQQVLQQGERPVLLVRPTAQGGAPPFTCRRFLVPLDGRPEHEASLPLAETVGKGCSAEIQLLVVVPTLQTMQGDQAAGALLSPQATAAVLDVAEEQACAYLTELGNRLSAEGVQVRAEVRRGDPARVTADVARKSEVDLLIVATHARLGLDALWSASVAPRVFRRLTQPVLLVRAAAPPTSENV